MTLTTLRGEKKLSILVIEDDVVSCMLLEKLCLKKGWDVHLASNGLEAVNMVMQKKPDVIVIDVQMPIMDGFEATRRIKMMPGFASIPIIAMTANALSGDKEKCIECGMDDYLSKPINVADFYSMIYKWTDTNDLRL